MSPFSIIGVNTITSTPAVRASLPTWEIKIGQAVVGYFRVVASELPVRQGQTETGSKLLVRTEARGLVDARSGLLHQGSANFN